MQVSGTLILHMDLAQEEEDVKACAEVFHIGKNVIYMNEPDGNIGQVEIWSRGDCVGFL